MNTTKRTTSSQKERNSIWAEKKGEEERKDTQPAGDVVTS
jgi:hypothetical protein